MGTSVTRHLSPEEIARLQDKKEAIEKMHSGASPGKFVFFAAFDGTNNDKDNLALSGSPYQTNVANLYDQVEANETSRFASGYYPGVGTGGQAGNLLNAALFPTAAIRAAAEQALSEFAKEAHIYLQNHPTATPADLSVATAGFSRGTASEVVFTRLLEERGLVLADGTQVAPPSTVRVSAMVMIDPVHTFVEGDLSLPPNVQGNVLVFRAEDEHRTDFRLADYSADPRVQVLSLPGNHSGLGGGYDLRGTAAVVLEGSTAYLRNSGVDVAPVPASLRFDPTLPAPIYTEGYQTARNGDVLGDPDTGRAATVWRLDDRGKERVGVPATSVREDQKDWVPVTELDRLVERLYQAAISSDETFRQQETRAATQQYLSTPDGRSWMQEVGEYQREQQAALERERQRQAQEEQAHQHKHLALSMQM
ncbi:MAG: DUF2235 domain-containing protein [Variovorax sp.]|nr:DUF2235 domain-containing protein [Variovorax sp.]